MDDMILDDVVNKVNELTAEQRRRVFKRASAKKPFVNFSSATFADCARKDGLALDLNSERVPVPALAKVQKCFLMDNEAAFRMLIDAILLEALESGRESEAYLAGSCEVRNDWEGPGLGYAGTVDYMIGSLTSTPVRPMDSFLLVVEAKEKWPDIAVAQVLAEAGCLLKRLDSLKKTPVFAVLTNGKFFRFFAIDENGVVYSSAEETLVADPSGAYFDSPSLVGILRWFNWFLGAMKDVSLRVSQTEVTDDEVKESLAQLRCCFGPRESPKVTGSKRIKICRFDEIGI